MADISTIFDRLLVEASELRDKEEQVRQTIEELRDSLLAMSDTELLTTLAEFRKNHPENLQREVPMILSMVADKRFSPASTRPRELDWVFDEMLRLMSEINRR